MPHLSEIVDPRLPELGEFSDLGTFDSPHDSGLLDSVPDRGLDHEVGQPEPQHGGQEADEQAEQDGMLNHEHPPSVRVSGEQLAERTYTVAEVLAILDRLESKLQCRRFEALTSNLTKHGLGMADGLTVASSLVDLEALKLGGFGARPDEAER